MNRTAIKETTEQMFDKRREGADRGTPRLAQPVHPRRKTMNVNARIVAGLALLLGLGGCVSPTPMLDEHFGEAVRAARLAQTINPDAGRNDPIIGMDGVAAQRSIERYETSFKNPPPVTNVVNIGGVIGSRPAGTAQ